MLELDSQCQRAIYVALKGGQRLTALDLSKRTGFTPEAIYKALNHPVFVQDGFRYSGVTGPSPRLYKLVQAPEPKPQPAVRNPVVDAALNDCAIMALAIKVLRRRGHVAAALKVAEAWQHEDKRLKRFFEETGS